MIVEFAGFEPGTIEKGRFKSYMNGTSIARVTGSARQEQHLGDLARLDVDFVALNARFTSRSLVRDLHRSGMEVMVWTVNDALGISVMAGRGVDAIITDDPGLAVEILAQRRELEAHGRLMLGLAELFDRPSLVSEQ